jgi:hypothetical protein
MQSAIPRSSLFNFAVKAYPAGAIAVDGACDEWDDRHRLPDLALDGGTFATMWMAWSPEALWFAVRVERTRPPQVMPNRPAAGDCIELYIDTRDVRSAHRAGRYCHKFIMAPVGRSGRAQKPFFDHVDVARATASPPKVLPEQVELAAVVDREFYSMEIRIPAEALFGYDIETNRRLGFAYVVHDIERPMQVWPHESELPLWVDPGLWAVVELVD